MADTALNVIDAERQIAAQTLDRDRLKPNFLNGTDWNLTNGANDKTITGVRDAVGARDVVPLGQVNSLIAAISKPQLPAVHTVSTSNITLSGVGQTISGRVLTSGDRVFAAGQTTSTADGVYIAAAGAWARSTDLLDALGADIGGKSFVVATGTFAEQIWVVTNDPGAGIVGTHDLVIASGSSAYLPPTVVRGESLTVTNGSPSATLANTPDATGVVITWRGVPYYEGSGFTRVGTAITWAANFTTADIGTVHAAYQY